MQIARGLALLLATLSVLLTGCDPGSAVNAIGVSIEKGETTPVIHWVLCPDEIIANVSLTLTKGQSEGEEDEEILWEVENRGDTSSTDFPVGTVVQGFETVRPLDDPIASAQGLVAVVKTNQIEEAIPFRLEQLRSDEIWAFPGKYFSPAEFTRRGREACPT